MDKGKRPLQWSAQLPVTHALCLWRDALQAALHIRVTEGRTVYIASFSPEQPAGGSEANGYSQDFQMEPQPSPELT